MIASTELTDRQREALDFIRWSLASRGVAPTLREIGDHMGIRSTNGVNDVLRALVRKGVLRREKPRTSRNLRLVGGHTTADLVDRHTVADLTSGIRQVARMLGVELGAPLPADWLRRTLTGIEEMKW